MTDDGEKRAIDPISSGGGQAGEPQRRGGAEVINSVLGASDPVDGSIWAIDPMSSGAGAPNRWTGTGCLGEGRLAKLQEQSYCILRMAIGRLAEPICPAFRAMPERCFAD
jgi:hypothetical protein